MVETGNWEEKGRRLWSSFFYHVLERRRRGERPCFLAKRPFSKTKQSHSVVSDGSASNSGKKAASAVWCLLLSSTYYWCIHSFWLCGLRANFQIVFKNVKFYHETIRLNCHFLFINEIGGKEDGAKCMDGGKCFVCFLCMPEAIYPYLIKGDKYVQMTIYSLSICTYVPIYGTWFLRYIGMFCTLCTNVKSNKSKKLKMP